MNAAQNGGEHGDDDKRVVKVSRHGQATIPKRFRDELGIDAPGRVTIERRDDEIIVTPVPSPGSMRGFVSGDGETGTRGTDLLREHRRKTKENLAKHTTKTDER